MFKFGHDNAKRGNVKRQPSKIKKFKIIAIREGIIKN